MSHKCHSTIKTPPEEIQVNSSANSLELWHLNAAPWLEGGLKEERELGVGDGPSRGGASGCDVQMCVSVFAEVRAFQVVYLRRPDKAEWAGATWLAAMHRAEPSL